MRLKMKNGWQKSKLNGNSVRLRVITWLSLASFLIVIILPSHQRKSHTISIWQWPQPKHFGKFPFPDPIVKFFHKCSHDFNRTTVNCLWNNLHFHLLSKYVFLPSISILPPSSLLRISLSHSSGTTTENKTVSHRKRNASSQCACKFRKFVD